MSSTTVKTYGITTKALAGSTIPSEYIQRKTKEELEMYVTSIAWDSVIVELETTIKFPDPELPTTVGSVIRARAEDRYSEHELWVIDADGDMTGIDDGNMGASYSPVHYNFFDVQILFDAATIS